jgi:hypothetical protein
MPTAPAIELEGMIETLRAVNAIKDAHEKKETNAQLRGAARECAARLVGDLRSAAASSGVPVAPRVARTAKVKGDRIPVVSIGDAKTGPLKWGSEQGPKSAPNRFAVSPNLGGYWIAPTVKRFGEGPAPEVYKRAVVDIYKEHGLL